MRHDILKCVERLKLISIECGVIYQNGVFVKANLSSGIILRRKINDETLKFLIQFTRKLFL